MTYNVFGGTLNLAQPSTDRLLVDWFSRSATAVARDSGVDSVLSLPHHSGSTVDDWDPDRDCGSGLLDGLRLADIRIPAAGDDDLEGTNDDDDDRDDLDERTSFSHYEDIDVLDPPLHAAVRRSTLQTDDLYLDPRHPLDQSSAASLRRQPTGSRSDRFGYVQQSCTVLSTSRPSTFV